MPSDRNSNSGSSAMRQRCMPFPIIIMRYFFSVLLISFFLFCCHRPQKDEIVKTVGELLKDKQSIFSQIVDTFQNIKSHSNDWQLENFAKRGVAFYSNAPFETYGISLDEYKTLYYAGIDSTTSPCYVEDFTIPSTFKKQIEQIDVYIVRIIKDSSGKTDRINFYFNFPPITRTIILSYFPNNIPDTLKGNQKYTYNVDWSWSHLFDSKWLLRSFED